MESDILAEFLKYDKNLPLGVVENPDGNWPKEAPDGRRQYHVTFSSVHDRRVPSLLALPANISPPYPLILMLHGALGHKSSFNQIRRSDFMTAAGYATLRIDGQYRGEREVTPGGEVVSQTQYHYRNRDAMIQTAVDLM
ncbi:MAG: acetylxylan esterase, partial [Candidatus Latescibacterota bacterium]